MIMEYSKVVKLTSLCPEMVFSNFPSYAPQIFISLSAAGIEKSELQSGSLKITTVVTER